MDNSLLWRHVDNLPEEFKSIQASKFVQVCVLILVLTAVGYGANITIVIRERKMGLKKRRPCGAVADVNELEYISALHQTGKDELREDGSIQGAYRIL